MDNFGIGLGKVINFLLTAVLVCIFDGGAASVHFCENVFGFLLFKKYFLFESFLFNVGFEVLNLREHLSENGNFGTVVRC